jgi:hypothetical protein
MKTSEEEEGSTKISTETVIVMRYGLGKTMTILINISRMIIESLKEEMNNSLNNRFNAFVQENTILNKIINEEEEDIMVMVDIVAHVVILTLIMTETGTVIP